MATAASNSLPIAPDWHALSTTIDSADHVRLIAEAVDDFEAARGMRHGATQFIVMIETAAAFFRMTEIAKAHGVTKVLPINPNGSQKIETVTITAVPAVHSSSYKEGENTIYAGAPIGFIVAEEGARVGAEQPSHADLVGHAEPGDHVTRERGGLLEVVLDTG